MTAAQVGEWLGVTREWVYDNADDLGVIRMGSGPRPRLRFDREVVQRALEVRQYAQGVKRENRELARSRPIPKRP